MNNLNIILVSVGNFQDYIIDNISQLIKLQYKSIYVITNKHFFPKLDIYKDNIKLIDPDQYNITNFKNNTKLNKKFRNGFWVYASMRLYLVCELIKKENLVNCIHIENDVLLYKNFESYNFENKLHLSIDGLFWINEKKGILSNDFRCIPGILYIPSYNELKFALDNFNYTKDDMFNLGEFYKNNKDKCITFPIIKKNSKYNYDNNYSTNYSKFNGIFDAAAIGQYLGGVDPRNIKGSSVGFINEVCVVKYNNYNFEIIIDNKGHKLPYIIIDNEKIPVYTLHIHSKNLKQFLI